MIFIYVHIAAKLILILVPFYVLCQHRYQVIKKSEYIATVNPKCNTLVPYLPFYLCTNAFLVVKLSESPRHLGLLTVNVLPCRGADITNSYEGREMSPVHPSFLCGTIC